MLKIDVSTGKGAKKDAVVLGCFQKKDAKAGTTQIDFACGNPSKECEELHSRLKQSNHFFGGRKEVSILRYYGYEGFSNTALMGLGTQEGLSQEALREAGGSIYFAQKQARIGSVSVRCEKVWSMESGAEYLQAFVEGYQLAHYEYSETKEEKGNPFHPKGMEISGLDSPALKKAVARGVSISQAVNFARSLGDRPGNLMTPDLLAKEVQKATKDIAGLTVKVWNKKEIEKRNMGLFIGVAKGSEEEPRLIHLSYRGGKKGQAPVALVGKGITFDSGGISLKPSAKMEDMKYDMMGAAAVAGIMKSVATLKLPINVDGFIAAAENMPDGKAQKPGDVARSFSGKTVEIINTDAEGRLVLADTLEYVQTLKPQAILDFATLTGAVLVALGTVTSGIMGNHPGLIARLKESAEYTGERVWELPLYPEYDEDLKSVFADIKNSGVRDAGSSKGGAFLKFFVDPAMPWVHCDIAGTAWARKDANYLSSKYGSGVMVRLMTHLLENWKPLK